MKPFFYLTAALALGGCATQTQQEPAPPIKMGLWEVVMDIRRIEPPMAATYVSQVCLTPETWRDTLDGTGKPLPGCDMHNYKQDAGGWSFDMVCKKQPGRFGSSDRSTHMQIAILSAEKVRTTTRSEHAESSEPFVLESLADGIYQGADCKGIKPGDYKRVSGS